eukprot:g1200.t1
MKKLQKFSQREGRVEEDALRLQERLRHSYDELSNLEEKIQCETKLQQSQKKILSNGEVRQLLKETIRDEIKAQQDKFLQSHTAKSNFESTVLVINTTSDVVMTQKQRFKVLEGTSFGELLSDTLHFWGYDRSSSSFVLHDTSGGVWPAYIKARTALLRSFERSGVMPELILARRPDPMLADMIAWQPKNLLLRPPKGASVDFDYTDNKTPVDFNEKKKGKLNEKFADIILYNHVTFFTDLFLSCVLLLCFLLITFLNKSPPMAYYLTSAVRSHLVTKPFQFDLQAALARNVNDTTLDLDPESFSYDGSVALLDQKNYMKAGGDYSTELTWESIASSSQLDTWLLDVFQPFCWKHRTIMNPEAPKFSHFAARNYINNFTQILGAARIWQSRIKPEYSDRDLSSLTLDKSDFGPGCSETSNTTNELCWRYIENAHFPLSSSVADYQPWNDIQGGVVLDLPMEDSNKWIDHLRNITGTRQYTIPSTESGKPPTSGLYSFIDEYTRGVGITLNLWNANTDYFITVELLSNFLPSGAVVTNYRLQLLTTRSASSLQEIMKRVMLFSCFATGLFPIFVLLRFLWDVFKAQRRRTRPTHMDELEKWSHFIRRQLIDFTSILFFFLKDVWAAVEIGFLITFFLFFANAVRLMSENDKVKALCRANENPNQFLEFGPYYETFMKKDRFMGYVSVFIILRMLKYLKLLRVLDLIITAITRAIPSLFALICIWVVARTGFVWFGVFAFGSELKEFNNFMNSFVNLLSVIVGMADSHRLPNLDDTTTPHLFQLFFWVVFVSWEYFAVLSMFCVILAHYYREVELHDRAHPKKYLQGSKKKRVGNDEEDDEEGMKRLEEWKEKKKEKLNFRKPTVINAEIKARHIKLKKEQEKNKVARALHQEWKRRGWGKKFVVVDGGGEGDNDDEGRREGKGRG